MSSIPSNDVPGNNQAAIDPDRYQRLEKYVRLYFNLRDEAANPQASLNFVQNMFEKILGESIPLPEIQLVMLNAKFQTFEQNPESTENPLYNLAQSDIELLIRDWEQGKI